MSDGEQGAVHRVLDQLRGVIGCGRPGQPADRCLVVGLELAQHRDAEGVGLAVDQGVVGRTQQDQVRVVVALGLGEARPPPRAGRAVADDVGDRAQHLGGISGRTGLDEPLIAAGKGTNATGQHA